MIVDGVSKVLRAAAIRHEIYWSRGSKVVFISQANQLFATKAVFDRAYPKNRYHAGWEAHHVLEYQDCERLGLTGRLPVYDEQICVLVPAAAHRERINGVLRHLLPIGAEIRPDSIPETYAFAYSMLGDYCGGTEAAIARELNRIVSVLIRG